MDTADGRARHGAMPLTVSLLIDSFRAQLTVSRQLGQITTATVDWYGYQLAKLRAAAGEFPADALRAHHLVTIEFTHHFVRALKALYKWASDSEVALVPSNPFRKLRTPSCGQRQRTLTDDEFRALLSVSPPGYRRFLRMMAYTLARPGEVRQLRWGQIDLQRRVATLTQFKGKGKRRDGKAVRLIPLPLPAVRLLVAIRKHAGGNPHPEQHVLLSARKKPWSANGIRCAMRRAREKAELEDFGERVVCYTMRHTGATKATRAGVRDRLLADIMGHTTTNTTRRYQHLDEADLVRGIDRLHGAAS